MKTRDVLRLIEARWHLLPEQTANRKRECEGGCGVVGLASSEKIAGRHIMQALVQMHNRGNGKGGGVAAVGLDAAQLCVPQEILDEDYLIHVAFLDPSCRKQVEKEFLFQNLDVHACDPLENPDGSLQADGLEVRPPDVWRYFCRVKEDVLSRFIQDNRLEGLERGKAEDEFIYQNTFRLNSACYASLGEKKAFVLSHGRNMMILKIVGYAEQVIRYYGLKDLKAHVWIGHQRYPTKGRVWHPGGAHPFAGMDEALVHNGDFANYHAITEYLGQRNIHSLFLTDTEVAALLFDLFNRIYEYPLEYVIEAMAPTTERDFALLPEEKRRVYRAVQASHIHTSPDGPWFFIIGRTERKEKSFQLLGITDTSMLRPQVFAIQENGTSIGLVASEKQAIDATLRSLHEEDGRFLPYADLYWNARGGSYTDGGAFVFTVQDGRLKVTDKFGQRISTRREHDCPSVELAGEVSTEDIRVSERIRELTDIIDNRWRVPIRERAAVLTEAEKRLNELFHLIQTGRVWSQAYYPVDWAARGGLSSPKSSSEVLVVNGEDFPAEGNESLSRFLVEASSLGWKNFITLNWRGQRFCGCGLGPGSEGVRIDVYGSSGDYLASGLDGAEVFVHENAQDQVAQIMKSGKLVVYGDVGQTFMYGAKGGEVYVLGNAAGRPLINAVGSPRVVINGTCLDYLAESFMAGNPLEGGGFVILNGLSFNEKGEVMDLETPYPGGNLFSLASGGAIYLRDPHLRVDDTQLNGGRFAEMTSRDWEIILPYLEENKRLFGISVERLLTVRGEPRPYNRVFRKVEATLLKVLAKTEY